MTTKREDRENAKMQVEENFGYPILHFLEVENDAASNWISAGGNAIPKGLQEKESEELVQIAFDDVSDGLKYRHDLVAVVRKSDAVASGRISASEEDEKE